MSRLAEILKQEYKTKGVFSGASSALSKNAREKMDIRNNLFGGSGLGSIIGRKIFGKGYSAIDSDKSKVSSASDAISSGSSTILQEISINGKITAKNSMSLPRLAEQMNIMQKNVAKLVTMQGETASTKAHNFFSDSKFRENAYEATFNKNNKSTKPTKVEEKKEGSGGLLGIIAAAGAIFASLLAPLGTLAGVLGMAGLAVAGFGRVIWGILGFLVKTKIGRLLGLAGLLGASGVFAGAPEKTDTELEQTPSKQDDGMSFGTKAAIGVAGYGIAKAGIKGVGLVKQTGQAISNAKVSANPWVQSAEKATPKAAKGLGQKSWAGFLRFLERALGKEIFAKIAGRLAVMGGLMAIPIVGWVGALLNLGFNLYMAYEIYTQWKKYMGSPDTDEVDASTNTSPIAIDDDNNNTISPTPTASTNSGGKGKMSGKFGEDRGDHKHAGVDWTGNVGDPIYATGDGKVVRADGKDAGGYGNQLEIQHSDGSKSKYAHLNGFAVKVGDKVREGQKIAEMGVTGRTTGPHLHYEKIDKDGHKIEPTQNEVQLAVNGKGDKTGTSSTQLALLQKELSLPFSGAKINSFSQEKELAKNSPAKDQSPVQVAQDNRQTVVNNGGGGGNSQMTAYDQYFGKYLIDRTT